MIRGGTLTEGAEVTFGTEMEGVVCVMEGCVMEAHGDGCTGRVQKVLDKFVQASSLSSAGVEGGEKAAIQGEGAKPGLT